MDILFSFLICLIATTAGGISGVGGGVIIKPVMDATSGLPVATISFLSGCTVLAMSFTSMVRSRSGEIKVEKRRGTPLALGAAVGGILGKELFEIVLQSGGNAVRIAQRIIGKVNESAGATIGRPVHISIGISPKQPDDTVRALFQRADEALYAAKHKGKNACCVYAPTL